MEVEATYDMALVRSILIIPEVWERAVEGLLDKDTYMPSFDDFRVWLLCTNDEGIVGLFYIHHDNVQSIKIHPYVIQKGKGRDMLYAFYKWIIDKPIEKVIVSIPFCFKETYNLSKKVGFVDEGVNRQSYTKDDKIYDQWNLGLTLGEIKELHKCHQY